MLSISERNPSFFYKICRSGCSEESGQPNPHTLHNIIQIFGFYTLSMGNSSNYWKLIGVCQVCGFGTQKCSRVPNPNTWQKKQGRFKQKMKILTISERNQSLFYKICRFCCSEESRQPNPHTLHKIIQIFGFYIVSMRNSSKYWKFICVC